MMNNILRIENVADGVSKHKSRKKKAKGKVKRRTRFVEPKKIAQRKVEEIDILDADSCTSIWQSVVVQALYDLHASAESYDQKLDKAKAIAWFGQGVSADAARPTDFEQVCELAQLSPFAIMKLAKQVMREEKIKKRESAVSSFNFRTVRKSSSNRVPKRMKGN